MEVSPIHLDWGVNTLFSSLGRWVVKNAGDRLAESAGGVPASPEGMRSLASLTGLDKFIVPEYSASRYVQKFYEGKTEWAQIKGTVKKVSEGKLPARTWTPAQIRRAEWYEGRRDGVAMSREREINLVVKSISEINAAISEAKNSTELTPRQKRAAILDNKKKIDSLAENAYPHITDEFAFYCISHGSPKTREHSVGEPEEEKVHTFRPELVDIVRINLRNAEISVFTKKTSSEHLRNFYVGAFGRIFLPDSHFVPNNKFELDKLRDKRTFIVGEFLGQIVSIEPFSFSYLTHSGCKREVSKSITEEFDEVIKNNWKIISMKFNVVFSDAPNKKCKISILSQNRSEFPVGANESIIENYFTNRGVIRDIYREETFKLVSGTSALSA